MLAPNIRRPARVEDVVTEVCLRRGVEPSRALSTSRLRIYVRARQEIWWRLRQMRRRDGTPYSYPQIGRWFDRDHSTVIQGVETFEQLLALEAAA